jgi:hypothetical protein
MIAFWMSHSAKLTLLQCRWLSSVATIGLANITHFASNARWGQRPGVTHDAQESYASKCVC